MSAGTVVATSGPEGTDIPRREDIAVLTTVTNDLDRPIVCLSSRGKEEIRAGREALCSQWSVRLTVKTEKWKGFAAPSINRSDTLRTD